MINFVIFILGLIIGSFLNVCIYRLPQNQSITTPSSHCMTCNTCLKPWDLIPVLSYLISRRRCRYCGTVYSPRYAMVELLTSILFVLCLQIFGLSPELVKALILASFLIIITFIDYDHQLILDNVLLWLTGAGIFINLWLGTIDPQDLLIASLLGGGLLFLIAVISRGGMGGGDIKFAAALGIWFGWKLLLLTLFLSFVFGGVGGLLLVVFRLKNRKDFIPFGPFITLGALISLLYGKAIISWYLGQLF